MNDTVWIHNKTGNEYYVLFGDALNCTNGQVETEYVVYKKVSDNAVETFIREREEFLEKFTEKK